MSEQDANLAQRIELLENAKLQMAGRFNELVQMNRELVLELLAVATKTDNLKLTAGKAAALRRIHDRIACI